MARAVRDFNSKDCYCGKDHNDLIHIAGGVVYNAMLIAGMSGQPVEPKEIAEAIKEAATQVGWVLAGDELEDLREENAVLKQRIIELNIKLTKKAK